MTRRRLSCLPLLFLSLPLAAGIATSALAAPHPTPEITAIAPLQIPGSTAYAMRARLGATRTYVGLALLCTAAKPPRTEITAYFGPFPSDARPVQLAVRNRDGKIRRFGPMVRGTPRSGFHSPRLTAQPDIRRFIDIALRPGSLISNGYTSFWNRVPAASLRDLRLEFLRCLEETER